ncbi:MAG: restriction endonuclease subunit S [bacterium]
MAALGLKLASVAKAPRCFSTSFEDFSRWSVSYNQAALTGTDVKKGKYPVVQLGSVLSLTQYGTSEKANTRGVGVPVLRMNNLVDGLLHLSAIKHVELPEMEHTRLLLEDGDILINRTNSKELVGKCAVFHETGPYIFASYLIRVRTKAESAHPDYVVFVLNSRIGRQQIDGMSRQIIGQANINSKELESLVIPLPPLAVQRRMVADVEAGRAQVARERETAHALSRQIESDLEGYLLGTKKMG